MVEEQIVARGVVDPHVLDAMRTVPRHVYVPAEYRAHAYADTPVPIGAEQTISQPFIVALMTELLALNEHSRVLEVGTGSGYQAAILGEIAKEVYTIEIIEMLGERARATLKEQGYDNVHVRIGDGYAGLPEAAPFDGILVAAAPDHVPKPLLEQLAEGGRLVIPVGRHVQELTIVTREGDDFVYRSVIPVRFVPMTGRARDGE